MYRTVSILMLSLLGGYASAHQFTPTYPEIRNSYVEGVKVINMSIFNNREEVSWYSIGVFDKDWESVPFASSNRLINLKYLQRKDIEVFIRIENSKDVTYVCSKSKILASVKAPAIITTRICSKIKRENDEIYTTANSVSKLSGTS